jgi:hypothetical protein
MIRFWIRLVVAGWLLTPAVFAAESLRELKEPYDAATGKIRAEVDTKMQALNQQYLRNLEALDAQYKKAGELDTLLIVRKEMTRFKASETVADEDVVTTPAALAAQQRSYTTTKLSLRRDRDTRIAKLARTYLDQLDQLKKTLTQRDKITEALEAIP